MRRGVVLKMLLLLVVLIQAEARVFCEDSHARPWEPLGYACPLNCANIMTAVKKLKTHDFSELFHKHQESNKGVIRTITEQNYTVNSTNENHETVKGNLRKHIVSKADIKIYEKYYKILNNENVKRDLKTEYNAALASLKACYDQNEVNNVFVKKLNICSRRSNIEQDFLKKFTSILNKYTKTITFTEELTAMILEKILGKNLDLRHGLFDVNRMLVILSTAIRDHEATREASNHVVINLRSTHCLYLKVPGCFCITGFVEKSGQCVKPHDCFEGPVDKGILHRIILH